MDSFKDFAEMVVRICKHPDTDCRHCPLADDFGCTHGYIIADILEKKEEIAKWLKEHREPVYPSWSDIWQEWFPDAKSAPCPEIYFGVKCCYADDKSCAVCKDKPIPAEIAKKLGIKPITQGEAGSK